MMGTEVIRGHFLFRGALMNERLLSHNVFPTMVYVSGRSVLQVDRLELIDALMNLCTYRHPENIALPAG